MEQQDSTPLGEASFEALYTEATTPPKRKFRLHLILLLATFATTTWAGVGWHLSFHQRAFQWSDLASGLPYAISVLGILLAHEMGHYLACRYYRIRATLPYLIPIPLLFGTAGAVIRIKSPFETRRQLFDVGILGPLAGFAALLPVLALGLYLSTEINFSLTPGRTETFFGEPLVFRLLAHFFFDGDPAKINLHPLGWAAWFGLLATGLNLIPMGQLDGGHIVYALFGPQVHKIVSHLMFAGLLGLSALSWPVPAYVLFALLIRYFGFRHPPTLVPGPRLGAVRVMMSVLAVAILVLSFLPVPIQFIVIE